MSRRERADNGCYLMHPILQITNQENYDYIPLLPICIILGTVFKLHVIAAILFPKTKPILDILYLHVEKDSGV